MATLLVLNFLASLYLLHRVVDCGIAWKTTEEDTFQPLCSRRCNNSSEINTDKTYPLYQCSCSRSCSIFGDCCYDSPYKYETYWHKIDFICLSIVGRGRYRAVSSCPPDQLSDFCKDGLGHLPPVTSRVTNTTYANIFCATCNGDRQNLVKWNVELRCPSEQGYKNEDPENDASRIQYISGDFWKLNELDGSKRQCMFHVHYDNFTFLDGLELRHCSSMRRISHCSASWRGLTVMKKCRSYEDPVYFHNTAYQNSHCAECNYLNPQFSRCIPFHVKNLLQMGLIDPNVILFCNNRGSETCIQSLFEMPEMDRGRPFAFHNMINVLEKECVPPPGKRCCEGKRYDSRSGRCRNVRQN